MTIMVINTYKDYGTLFRETRVQHTYKLVRSCWLGYNDIVYDTLVSHSLMIVETCTVACISEKGESRLICHSYRVRNFRNTRNWTVAAIIIDAEPDIAVRVPVALA